MITKELIEKIKKNKHYKNFTYFEKPVLFKDHFKDKPYELVQIQDMTPVNSRDILGFAGTFEWKDNKIVPLDGDSYSPDMEIWGYEEFESEGRKCLDILTENW